MQYLKNITSVVILTVFISVLAKAQQPDVIPLPKTYVKENENFPLTSHTNLMGPGEQAQQIASIFRYQLFQLTHLPLNIDQRTYNNEIKFEIKANENAPEGYEISIHHTTIVVTGNSAHGLFNGVQTLLQLIVKSKGYQIPCWNIHDQPLYTWRGIMLDESRHFFGKAYVKSLLDWMALYKLDRFHWHLTDEPGWRIEIKSYPKLALVGGTGNFSDSTAKACYYTQDDINEIVNYAHARYIQVIPEIDMPGHASAANRAYPQYSGGGSPKHPDFTFNPGSEQTYAYISNILHEVNVLFPGKMIHIGGDEVSFGRDNWNQLSGIKTFMDANHLSILDEVENYFTHRISDTLQNWGTLTGVWDEAVNAHLPAKQTTIFWWRQNHPEQLKTALALGYHIVLCPRLPMYFDFVQLKTDQLGRKWDNGEFNALADVYAFPQSLKLPESEDTKNIDGIQANLWTETVISTQRADYLLFPRIAALAEAAWTAAGQKDYTHFLGRLQSEYLMYLKAGIYYCPADSAVYHPEPAR